MPFKPTSATITSSTSLPSKKFPTGSVSFQLVFIFVSVIKGFVLTSFWSGDWTSMAVSLSSNVVKLYSPVTGQYYGECRGHIGTINQISFAVPSTPHVLHSCSSDGTIRSWDVRNFQQVWFVLSSFYFLFIVWFGSLGYALVCSNCRFHPLVLALLKRSSALPMEDRVWIFLLQVVNLRWVWFSSDVNFIIIMSFFFIFLVLQRVLEIFYEFI